MTVGQRRRGRRRHEVGDGGPSSTCDVVGVDGSSSVSEHGPLRRLQAGPDRRSGDRRARAPIARGPRRRRGRRCAPRRLGAGNRYDGPCTCTAARLGRRSPTTGRGDGADPGDVLVVASRRDRRRRSSARRSRSVAGSISVRSVDDAAVRSRYRSSSAAAMCGEQDEARRHHVGRDPLTGPVAHLDLVVGGDLVDVDDVAHVEDATPGHLVQRRRRARSGAAGRR